MAFLPQIVMNFAFRWPNIPAPLTGVNGAENMGQLGCCCPGKRSALTAPPSSAHGLGERWAAALEPLDSRASLSVSPMNWSILFPPSIHLDFGLVYAGSCPIASFALLLCFSVSSCGPRCCSAIALPGFVSGFACSEMNSLISRCFGLKLNQSSPTLPPKVIPKLKPRWDVHLSGDDDQLGYAGESLSSVLGE